jgi:hypothetical protein
VWEESLVVEKEPSPAACFQMISPVTVTSSLLIFGMSSPEYSPDDIKLYQAFDSYDFGSYDSDFSVRSTLCLARVPLLILMADICPSVSPD